MSVGSFHAIVPVKHLRDAKSRLSPALGGSDRAALVLAMLDNVLAAARDCERIDRLTVLTSDPLVSAHARGARSEVFAVGRPGLNFGLASAVDQFARKGTDAFCILHADLPWLEVQTLSRFLRSVPEDGVGVATDHREQGTSALAWRGSPGLRRFVFGPGSSAAHIQAAGDARMPCHVARACRGFHDVDTPSDLAELLADRPEYLLTARIAA